MGEMSENITPRKLCIITSTDGDTMRMRFAKLRKTNPATFPDSWRIDGELNPVQVEALVLAGKRNGGVKKESEAVVLEAETVPEKVKDVVIKAVEIKEPKIKKAWLPKDWRTKLFTTVTFLLVIGHAGLVWYDMAALWAIPGKIGGGVVFAFIFSGMVLMGERSEKMAEIRENMLWAVGLLEALAVVVHRATFYRSASEAYLAGLGDAYTWSLASVICLCSIGATIFYQKVIGK